MKFLLRDFQKAHVRTLLNRLKQAKRECTATISQVFSATIIHTSYGRDLV
jgi:hypothetical protein